jgi:hypothetical protein
MPSNICLVETPAQSLERDASRYTLNGKERRGASGMLAVAKVLPIKTISNEQKNEKEIEE